jgi:hypothetical protein
MPFVQSFSECLKGNWDEKNPFFIGIFLVRIDVKINAKLPFTRKAGMELKNKNL